MLCLSNIHFGTFIGIWSLKFTGDRRESQQRPGRFLPRAEYRCAGGPVSTGDRCLYETRMVLAFDSSSRGLSDAPVAKPLFPSSDTGWECTPRRKRKGPGEDRTQEVSLKTLDETFNSKTTAMSMQN